MIVISPYARAMREPKPHPKNYPWWEEVVDGIKRLGERVIQIGIKSELEIAGVDEFQQNLTLAELRMLINRSDCTTWISVDSFFQHFCWHCGAPGIVLWGQSDPLIFGHPENVNLLVDRKYLREKQFWLWEQAAFNAKAFVLPARVIQEVQTFMHK